MEYLKKNDALLNKAKLIDMNGVPAGQPSYLVCGKKMDAARMQKLNQAIEKLSLLNWVKLSYSWVMRRMGWSMWKSGIMPTYLDIPILFNNRNHHPFEYEQT